jgi:dTDP-4-amino-4,6-dideoxygalactose transaminase
VERIYQLISEVGFIKVIFFNRPPHTGNEEQYVLEAMRSSKISGDGFYGLKCQAWFEKKLGCRKALLTPSCTHALEMAALLIDIQPGDEVIMPSYTFVSTANAFALQGAKIVFVDIRPDTMNIDEKLIESAITEKTKAIVPVHYAGVACEMDIINEIARKHNLFVVEDAAQGIMSTYKGRPLGTLGHLGAYSFHETKNFTSGGEGGLLIINDEQFLKRADVIREKGTNRSQFFRGMVDKYTWIDLGSSYLPSELQAAYLWGQLEISELIAADRLNTWNSYYQAFLGLAGEGKFELPLIPGDCVHNGHIFYLKCASLGERSALIDHLNHNDVMAVFHYVPLHTAPACKKFGRFHADDLYTSSQSERLLRLPIWFGMPEVVRERVIAEVKNFFSS